MVFVIGSEYVFISVNVISSVKKHYRFCECYRFCVNMLSVLCMF